MTQYVYRFGGGVSDGGSGDKTLLGGKGANLAEMASIGLPVPPGFTIATTMCTRYYEDGERFPDSLREEVATGIAHIEGITGKRFGDNADPLLVSVRSGARVSMPGMMDTVLNLGLNDQTVEGLASVSDDARFAWDSYRRFIQMYSDVVLELVLVGPEVGDPQDDELGLPAGQRAARHQPSGEAQPPAEQLPLPTEREEDVRPRGAGDPARDPGEGPREPADVGAGAGCDARFAPHRRRRGGR